MDDSESIHKSQTAIFYFWLLIENVMLTECKRRNSNPYLHCNRLWRAMAPTRFCSILHALPAHTRSIKKVLRRGWCKHKYWLEWPWSALVAASAPQSATDACRVKRVYRCMMVACKVRPAQSVLKASIWKKHFGFYEVEVSSQTKIFWKHNKYEKPYYRICLSQY